MSLNGLLEAFHASSASPGQIAKQARWMIASSGAFAVGLWVLSGAKLGISTEQCLVYASCLSMIMRIIYAGNHARQYFEKTLPISITEILPHSTILAIAAVGAAVVRRLEGLQVLLGTGGFGLITLIALYVPSRVEVSLTIDMSLRNRDSSSSAGICRELRNYR